ncbi:TPA: hypothetical protein ACH3X2_000564 [Trebouxia sp. C0005]
MVYFLARLSSHLAFAARAGLTATALPDCPALHFMWHFKKVWARSALARALHQYAFSQDGHLNKAPTKHFTETLAESLPGNPEC